MVCCAWSWSWYLDLEIGLGGAESNLWEEEGQEEGQVAVEVQRV